MTDTLPLLVQNYCKQQGLSLQWAILGGSAATANNAKDQLPSSDHDIVILVDDLKYPMSHGDLKLGNYKCDLIFRDPATLEYSFDQAKKDGNGVIHRILAEGDVLCGQNVKIWQERARILLDEGPLQQDTFKPYAAIQRDIALLQSQPTHVQKLASYEIMHDLAHLHLQNSRHWTAKGKIMARYMMQYPDFKQQLENTFKAAHIQGVAEFSVVLNQTQPKQGYLYCEESLIDQALQEPNEEARYNFLARTSGKYRRAMLGTYGGNKGEIIACNHMATKIQFVAKTLTKERFEKPNREYDYALARFVLTAAEMVSAKARTDLLNPDITKRYSLLLEKYPTMPEIIEKAAKGDPSAIHQWASDFATMVTFGHLPSMTTRFDPASFRIG